MPYEHYYSVTTDNMQSMYVDGMSIILMKCNHMHMAQHIYTKYQYKHTHISIDTFLAILSFSSIHSLSSASHHLNVISSSQYLINLYIIQFSPRLATPHTIHTSRGNTISWNTLAYRDPHSVRFG